MSLTSCIVQNILAKHDPRGRRLTLDTFILVVTQVKRLTDSFKARDRELRGQAVISYEDFIAHNGEQGARDAGRWRLEGKDYVVQDGDVIHFRFNV